MFGIKIEDFEKILQKVDKQWVKKNLKTYKRPGRNYKLDISDMLLMLFLYYRSYMTQMMIGAIFSIDDSRVCRIIKKLEPIIKKIVSIEKKKLLSKEEAEKELAVLIDATEQQIERPKKYQELYYSGKKKAHTIKTEIRTTINGKIINVSESVPGAKHDFALYKEGKALEKNKRVFADSGYQGLDKIHQETEIPYKKSKNKSLNEEEKDYNFALSKIRIKVENVFANIKVFRILSDRYRNKRIRYGIKFNIIAGLVNIKNGFTAI